jgi:hypothetical protein
VRGEVRRERVKVKVKVRGKLFLVELPSTLTLPPRVTKSCVPLSGSECGFSPIVHPALEMPSPETIEESGKRRTRRTRRVENRCEKIEEEGEERESEERNRGRGREDG